MKIDNEQYDMGALFVVINNLPVRGYLKKYGMQDAVRDAFVLLETI